MSPIVSAIHHVFYAQVPELGSRAGSSARGLAWLEARCTQSGSGDGEDRRLPATVARDPPPQDLVRDVKEDLSQPAADIAAPGLSHREKDQERSVFDPCIPAPTT